MSANPRLGILALLFLGFCLSSLAQPAVTVRIATVEEADWLRESQQGPPETLRDRLKAQTIIELHGGTVQDGKLVLRSGHEEEIVEHWNYADTSNDPVVKKTRQEWIGTQVVVVQQGLNSFDGTDKLLDIELTHDIAPPDSRLYQYMTAAKGAEREKHTVPMPRFHRLHWKGNLPPDQTERAIASFPSDENPGTRIVVFFHRNFGQKAPPYEITQTIYRVPELEMIELMLAKPAGDAAIVEHLEKARVAGRASIVSEVSTLTGQRRLMGSLQSGTEHQLPTEMSPQYDLLYQLPCAFETELAGTKLVFETDPVAIIPPRKALDPKDPFYNRPILGSPPTFWQTWFSLPGPVAVKWPTSWLTVYDRDHKPTGKAITGFMDWYDSFNYDVITPLRFHENAPRVVAMLPPADQVWGTERQGRWLDVTVARRQSHGVDTEAKSGTGAEISSPWLLLGISLDSRAALKLLEQRGGQDDGELLRQLMQRVKEKTANIRLCTASVSSTSRQTLTSGRMHRYPTEMPSIPSAWDARLIGTRVENDEDFQMNVEQDLAPPARMEWKLALDVPEAIMWEPSPRKIKTDFAPPRKSGTYLCSAAAIPAILADKDMPGGETLITLMHQDRYVGPAPVEPPKPIMEIETLVFEVPAAEADIWQAVKTADFAAFTAKQLDAGHAKLSGHIIHRHRSGSDARLMVAEEQMTATEFDPPEPQAPLRMRPTALEILPVGTSLEARQVLEGFSEGTLIIDLRHSIARPVEPSLPERLKQAAKDENDYPAAQHLFSQWKLELPKFQPDTWHFLEVRKLPGNEKTVHVAYVRLREAR